ncbi:MAG: hypothetical protein EBT06_00005, partial [Gammaproteobacteria bacterium]|nr:hypothetical protein [Gammaproteobacteria bacterium]
MISISNTKSRVNRDLRSVGNRPIQRREHVMNNTSRKIWKAPVSLWLFGLLSIALLNHECLAGTGGSSEFGTIY